MSGFRAHVLVASVAFVMACAHDLEAVARPSSGADAALVDRLTHRNPLVRRRAAEEMARLGPGEASAAIAELAKRARGSDNNDEPADRAAQALADIGSPQ